MVCNPWISLFALPLAPSTNGHVIRLRARGGLRSHMVQVGGLLATICCTVIPNRGTREVGFNVV